MHVSNTTLLLQHECYPKKTLLCNLCAMVHKTTPLFSLPRSPPESTPEIHLPAVRKTSSSRQSKIPYYLANDTMGLLQGRENKMAPTGGCMVGPNGLSRRPPMTSWVKSLADAFEVALQLQPRLLKASDIGVFSSTLQYAPQLTGRIVSYSTSLTIPGLTALYQFIHCCNPAALIDSSEFQLEGACS